MMQGQKNIKLYPEMSTVENYHKKFKEKCDVIRNEKI